MLRRRALETLGTGLVLAGMLAVQACSDDKPGGRYEPASDREAQAAAEARELKAEDAIRAGILANRTDPAVDEAAAQAADRNFLDGLDRQLENAATDARAAVANEQASERRDRLGEMVSNAVGASGNAD